MSIKTIFLDRDGVINKEVNYLSNIEDFEFIEGVFKSCNHFLSLNYKIIIVTNQSGISRGLYSLSDYEKVTSWMISQFQNNNIEILDIFYCPHKPSSVCNCRKPKPGMLIDAKNKHKIDMKKSWLIGDKENDITAANNAGITNTVLVRSGHKINESQSNAKYILDSIFQSIQVIID
jgi:D-glycero-D-manno-heptose 1,7-bisphosphate phosphatase